ncbi:hypothetical protein I302_107033 [Kwoniella bestiolae CBS 10118]|uniref:Uncharacterized protein n=1 Tax=Kwoniella bestiolae CBS 10118 TaxID=1296100 RepID=A0A1B9FZP9_9TREE|nr:hypothetical protein I302_05702 [Kwoniella bestiolae CBS 10118]OCF24243.1 hypothetical protein I302_05702 [Kwoniella bestiolae CBS 10118]
MTSTETCVADNFSAFLAGPNNSDNLMAIVSAQVILLLIITWLYQLRANRAQDTAPRYSTLLPYTNLLFYMLIPIQFTTQFRLLYLTWKTGELRYPLIALPSILMCLRAILLHLDEPYVSPTSDLVIPGEQYDTYSSSTRSSLMSSLSDLSLSSASALPSPSVSPSSSFQDLPWVDANHDMPPSHDIFAVRDRAKKQGRNWFLAWLEEEREWVKARMDAGQSIFPPTQKKPRGM